MRHAQTRPAGQPHRRTFLFLQGPHGPFFPRLGAELARRGARVERINLNGGDQATWPGGRKFRGPPGRWPDFVRHFLDREQVTDLVVYGDCRPHHAAAIAIAREGAVRVHVFEEGYLRPDWVTLERDGVNGNSPLPSDAAWYEHEAAKLPAPPSAPPPLPGYADARRWAAFFYYAQVTLQRWRFPFGPAHRARNPIWEGLHYLAKFRRAPNERLHSDRALAALGRRPFMLFPLQLDSDYQIRTHSTFGGMRQAARHVLANFAEHAPAELALVIKEHPLDSGTIPWRSFFDAAAAEFGLRERLAFIEDGDLDALVRSSLGMVTVNSTAATLALGAGKPVKALGNAVYDMAGITDPQPLDGFWTAPEPPRPEAFDAFRRLLVARCLLPGAFLSETGAADLVSAAAERLFGHDRGSET